jgi:hypothetical protein
VTPSSFPILAYSWVGLTQTTLQIIVMPSMYSINQLESSFDNGYMYNSQPWLTLKVTKVPVTDLDHLSVSRKSCGNFYLSIFAIRWCVVRWCTLLRHCVTTHWIFWWFERNIYKSTYENVNLVSILGRTRVWSTTPLDVAADLSRCYLWHVTYRTSNGH